MAATLATAQTPRPPGPNVIRDGAPLTSDALSVLDQVELSNRLARYGRERSDPYALIEAARIRLMATGQRAVGTADVVAGNTSVADLLVSAEALAPDNTAVRAQVASVRSIVLRAVPRGLSDIRTARRSARPKAGDRQQMTFAGREPAVVYIEGEADAYLNLAVYDDLNNLICERADNVAARCEWRPSWTGAFLVEIRNSADSEIEYVLAANNITPSTKP